MANDPDDRAPQVCLACKLRKRGCDKILPRCGYCVKKGQHCQYDADKRAADATTYSRHTPSPLECLLGTSRKPTLDERMERQVSEILQLTCQTLDEVGQVYFAGFQLWLPVVSPTRFYSALLEQQSGAKPLPASLSMLHLAMILITLRPYESSDLVGILYIAVKTSHAQLQACDGPSLLLLQSALLITAYEYACDLLDAAYLTIGTCARVGYCLGLDVHSQTTHNKTNDNEVSLEKLNAWWGVLILERMIACEMPEGRRRLSTSIPTDTSIWPADFGDSSRLHPLLSTNGTLFNHSSLTRTTMTSFGYHAEALQMLDNVLAVSGSAAPTDTKLIEMHKLDKDLTAFLISVMIPSTWCWGVCCGAIGTCVRALFVLHNDAAYRRGCHLIPTQARQDHGTSEALDTITGMMVDIAFLHVDDVGLTQINTVPLSNPHNLHQAVQYLQKCQSLEHSDERERGKNALIGMKKLFHQKWIPPPVIDACDEGG